MQEIRQKLQELLAPLLERHNAFVVDIALRHDRGTRLVQVFLDTDEGIKIDQCAEISRELSRTLDAAGLISTSYRLEISSPGIDKPVRLLRQYRKNIGRRFKVTYRKEQERKTIVGSLNLIDGDTLTFLLDTGEALALDFADIIESKEELPW